MTQSLNEGDRKYNFLEQSKVMRRGVWRSNMTEGL